jgi:hypothetical protein
VEGFFEHVINLLVSLNAEKYLSSCATGNISRKAQLHLVI